jgi:hypothetical protein
MAAGAPLISSESTAASAQRRYTDFAVGIHVDSPDGVIAQAESRLSLNSRIVPDTDNENLDLESDSQSKGNALYGT